MKIEEGILNQGQKSKIVHIPHFAELFIFAFDFSDGCHLAP